MPEGLSEFVAAAVATLGFVSKSLQTRINLNIFFHFICGAEGQEGIFQGVCSSNGFNSWIWEKQKPETWSSILIFRVGDGTQALELSSPAFPGALAGD